MVELTNQMKFGQLCAVVDNKKVYLSRTTSLKVYPALKSTSSHSFPKPMYAKPTSLKLYLFNLTRSLQFYLTESSSPSPSHPNSPSFKAFPSKSEPTTESLPHSKSGLPNLLLIVYTSKSTALKIYLPQSFFQGYLSYFSKYS